MGREEFARRVQAIRERLYRAAYLYLGSEADALEAVDEAVYQALRNLKKLRRSEYFETWLTRILINECHKELRRRKRFAPEEAMTDAAAPEELDHLPLKEAIARLPRSCAPSLFCGTSPDSPRRRPPKALTFHRVRWPPGSAGLWSFCDWSLERRRAHEPK